MYKTFMVIEIVPNHSFNEKDSRAHKKRTFENI